jgi:hypothetical protein
VHGSAGRDETFMWEFNGGRSVISLAESGLGGH